MQWSTIILLVAITLASSLLRTTVAVNRTSFKTCEQSSFCRRCRSLAPGTSQFQLVSGTMLTSSTSEQLTVDLVNNENGQKFVLRLTAVNETGYTFRTELDEKTPLKQRYRVEDSLQQEPSTFPYT